MALERLRKNDRVLVTTGRERGKTGKVLRVLPERNRVVIEGLNMVKRHQKQTAQQEGGIISKEASIHLSNVALADPKDGKPTRVGFKTMNDGRKVRVARRSGVEIDG
jgi:large subunit ribosomal protein L24